MDETKVLYSNVAVGGPLDGRTVESRFPKGIVFVSKPENTAWIYDRYSDGRFYVRPSGYDFVWDELEDEQKRTIFTETVQSGLDPARELDWEKIELAANSNTYEVRALPDEDGGE